MPQNEPGKIKEDESHRLAGDDRASVYFRKATGCWEVRDRDGESVLSGGTVSLNGRPLAEQLPEVSIEILPEGKETLDGRTRGRVVFTAPGHLEIIWETSVRLGGGIICFQMACRNLGNEPVRIHDFAPIVMGKWHVGEANPDSLRFLDGRCGGGATSVTGDRTLQSENNFLATIGNGAGRRSLVAGGLSYEDFAKYVEASWNETEGLLEFTMEARDAVGRLVGPGETYSANDAFYLSLFETDPFTSLENYGMNVRQAMDAQPNAYTFPTVCGWYASMIKYGGGPFINDTAGMVREAEAAKQVGLSRYTPLACRLVPDTYDVALGERIRIERFHPSILSKDRNTEQGWWDEAHYRQFGHLAEPFGTFAEWGKAMTERGAIFFMYVQPGNASMDYIEAHSGHFLNNDISDKDKPFDQMPHVHLDYTDEDFVAHVQRTWETMRAGGIKGVMFDYPHYCWHEEGGFEDPKATTASAYRRVFALAKEGLGPDSFIHERNVKRDWKHYVDVAVGVIDSQRVIGDTDIVTPEIIMRCALRWYKNRVLYALDTDAKHMHKVLPADREGQRRMLTMLYVVSGRFMFGHTTAWLNSEMLHDVSRIFPMHEHPQSARPLDAFTKDGCPTIFGFRVNSDWHQLTLFNEDIENPQTIEVPLANSCADGGLGLDATASYYIYDFWNDALRGLFDGDTVLTQELRAGEARMLSVRKQKAHPQVLSTDRHVMQGFVDLHNERWNAGDNCLQAESDLIGGEVYRVRIASNGAKVSSPSADGAQAWIEGEPWRDNYVTLCLLSGDNNRVSWKLHHEKNKSSNQLWAQDNLVSFPVDDKETWLDHIQAGVTVRGRPPISTGQTRFVRTSVNNGNSGSWHFEDRERVLDLRLNWRSVGDRSVICHLELFNRSNADLQIESIDVCRGRIPGTGKIGRVIPNSYWVGYRTAEEKIFTPEPERNYNYSYWTLTIEEPSFAAGFITGFHNVNRFGLKRTGPDMEIRAWAEGSDVLLPAGGSRITDKLFLSAERNSLAEMERFGDLAGEACGRRLPEENIATWCSWYSGWMGRQRQQYITKWKGGLERGVLSQIEPIAELLGSRKGNRMRIVDDSRTMSIGDWDDSTTKIPGGYASLAKAMKDHGIHPGVWITPFYVGTATQLYKERPELLVRDEEGKVFLPGYAGIDCGLIDSTVDGAATFFEEMGRKWRDRGFDYVMTDFLRSQLFAPCFADRTQTPIEAHRIALESLRRGFGDDLYWLGCTALPGPCMGLVDSFRISGDSFGGVTKKGGPFAYTQSAYRWFYHRRVWLNDPDSVISRGYWNFKNREYVRESHPSPYLQAYFSWIAVAGLAVTYGDTFDDDLPEANQDIYRKMFPPLPTSGRPLDLWENDPHYLWGSFPSTNTEHPCLLGAFTLFEKHPLGMKVNLAEAVRRTSGFETKPREGVSFRAWDFWNQRELDVRDGLIEFELQPQSCLLLAVAEAKNRPFLISTSSHFSQGAMELPELEWHAEEQGGVLQGQILPNGGDPMSLFLCIPGSCRGIAITIDGVPVQGGPVLNDIFEIPISATKASIQLSVSVESCGSQPKPTGDCAAPIIEISNLESITR